VDETLLCAATNYWVPLRHVFRFNKIELCPTIEEFAAIMGELEIYDLIFPTMGGDLPSLLRVVLGVLETMAHRWCVFGKLNLRVVLYTFPIWASLRVKGHDHTTFMHFAYIPLQGISWFNNHMVWTFRCVWWLMS